MTSESLAPVLKNPEPLEVLPLLEKWIEAGFAWRGMQLFWLGNQDSRQNYVLKDSAGVVLNIQVIALLSEDEKIIFRAFQDWFNNAIKKVAELARGYFTFEILQFEIGDAPWSWSEFTVLLTTHAKKLTVNERRLIQFAGLWGVLHKRTEAEFGRIESKLNLDFCKSSQLALARLIKKQSSKLAPNTILILRDLSRGALADIVGENEAAEPPLFQPSKDTLDQSVIYVHPGSKRFLRVGLP